LQLAQIQSVAQDYPAATADGEVQLQNLPDARTVQVMARFRLPHPLGDGRDPHFGFYAESLAEAVQARDEATRRWPLSVPWPMKLEQHIEAALPKDFTSPTGSVLIETSAYRYQREVRMSQGTVHITHSYVARADHVEPADYPAFLRANAQVTQALSVQVRPGATSWQRSLAWLNERALILMGVLVVSVTLVSAAWRRLRPG
jgi:hypothetical protein